jgi:hypothetical protein
LLRLRVLIVATFLLALPAVSAAPKASATHVAQTVVFYQGNLTNWVNALGANGAQTVANLFSQADVVVISQSGAHVEGGSEWPNLANGAKGCYEADTRATLINVLDKLRVIDASRGYRTLVFGYVSGAADAPDQSGIAAHCGNNVNNFRVHSGTSTTQTTFTACPGGACTNTVYWVNQWTDTRDTLYWYIDGIFYDYVSSATMSTSVRDNIYSYVKTKSNPITHETLRIMANSLTPGFPCGGACTSLGEQESFQFAADSNYMTANDYVLSEGYYASGVAGHCTNPGPSTTGGPPGYAYWCTSRNGTATLLSSDTNAIAGYRNTVANAHGGVRVKLAALVTEPPDAAFSSLSCTWSDFTNAKSVYNASKQSGDVINFQIADLGTLDWSPADGVPDRTISVCPYP